MTARRVRNAMRRYLAVVAVAAALAASDWAADPVGNPAGSAEVAVPPIAEDASVPATAASEADASTAQAAEPEAALSARERYNVGLAALDMGDYAGAAEAFLAARDDAGGDARLRYRSAFNLGLALAGQADGSADGSPDGLPDGLPNVPPETPAEEAIETLRSSAAWFSDAARLAPDGDEDARVNLEIVLRRIQQLADRLNRDGHLEARLDRIVDDQRGLRDQLRGLLADADAESEDGGDFRHRFESLAAAQRALLAATADVADLAAEERAHLEGQGEDALTPEQRARIVQLANMDHYLQRARQSMSDTRRRLRRIEGERGHRRADTALAELKRAREQLFGPVAVMKAIVRDETSVVAHADALAAVSADEDEGVPPPWLNVPHLTNRQEDAAARTGEMLRRLETAVASTAAGEPPADPPGDPEAQRARQAMGEALPHVRQALDAMRSALAAFAGGAVSDAAREGAGAIAALARAIELFAGLRELIEIAHADQARAVALLEADAEASEDPGRRWARAAIDDNRGRLRRMEAMLLDTLQQASPEGDEEASRTRYELAESLRGEALDALDEASGALRSGGEADPPARLALERIETLRRLFFSIAEHLQELLAEQTDTHDQTATLQVGSETAPPLGFVAERQATHAASGQALGEALAAQADAARAEENGEAANPIAEATRELRAGTARMRGAAATMSAAAEAARRMSPHLEPALTDQIAAIGHIENAIRLLRPPSADDGDSGGERQHARTRAEPAEQLSRRQALRRLQAVRDREAERQRRRQRDPAPPAPVEKDW